MSLDSIRDLIAELASIPHRGAGTPGERQAAEIVRAACERLGLDTELQTFAAPKILGHAVVLCLALAMAGLAVGFAYPLVGVVAIALGYWALTLIFNVGRTFWIRAVPCGESTNVIARRVVPGAKRTFVFSAHLDAGQTGLMFQPFVKRLFARLSGDSKSVQGPMFLPAMVVLVGASLLVARALGAGGDVLDGLQIAALAFLAVSLLVTAQFMLSPVVPGAIDNASGIAAMLEVARDLTAAPIDDTNLVFVATGAEETGMIGMKHFFRTWRDRLPEPSTYFFNFESVGGGTLHIVEEEGELARFKYPPFLIGFAQHVARRSGFGPLPTVNLLAGTDSVVTANQARPTLCLIALDELGVPPNYHEMADTADRVDFAVTRRAADFAVAVARELERDGF